MFFACYDEDNTVVEVLYVAQDQKTYRFSGDDNSAWEPTALRLCDFTQCFRFATVDMMMDWNYDIPDTIKSSLIEDVYSYRDQKLPA